MSVAASIKNPAGFQIRYKSLSLDKQQPLSPVLSKIIKISGDTLAIEVSNGEKEIKEFLTVFFEFFTLGCQTIEEKLVTAAPEKEPHDFVIHKTSFKIKFWKCGS